MSDPLPPDLPPPPGAPPEVPPAPQPFAEVPAEPRMGGCGKPALIGCGVVFLLLGIAGVFLVLNAKKLLVWSLTQAKPSVLANAGPDVTPADRARFEQAFEAAVARVREGKIDPIALQAVQGQLMKAVEKPGVPRATFLALTEAFEKLGGVAPPAEAPASPAPAVDPPPAAASLLPSAG